MRITRADRSVLSDWWFTVDRLMTMLSRLGSRVEVRVKVKPVHAGARALAA